MAARFFAGSAVLATLGFAEDITLNPALEADDACQAGGEECGLELRQLRGEINSAQAVIAEQLEENKKYEVALDDESGYTCKAPKGWKTTPMNCGPTTKCCTSQPSYVAGTPHSAQARLSLYSICCPLDTHCKYDTIFVSCAGGAGKDDYSGVIAGLQEDVETNDPADDEAEAIEQAEEEDAAAAEDLAEDEVSVEPIDEEAAEEEDEGLAELQADDEVTGGKCMNKADLGIWKSGGKQQYDTALDHCGTSCAAGFPCTRDCMKKHGYSTGCASCMAHAVECGRDHCLSQCISNHMSKACVHCNKKACRPVMKKCSGWAVGGH